MRRAVRRVAQRLGAVWPARVEPPARPEVVVIRPDHLGDVLFALPALERARAALPGIRLTVLVGPWSYPVVARDPHVDEVRVVRFPGFTRAGRSRPLDPYRELSRLAAWLRRRAPLAGVVLRDDHWWGAWALKAAGIPVRIGADHPATRPFLSHPVPLTTTHWVERNCELLDATVGLLGGRARGRVTPEELPLRWYPWPGAVEEAQRLLDGAGIVRPYAVIHPGAGAPVKRWPASRWGAVGRALVGRGLQVAVTGSADEAELAETIRSSIGAGAVNLAGRTSVPGLAEILRRACVVLGPDSGPLHLGVAVGTPTLHLYGPSQLAHYGPWGDPHRHRALTAGSCCPRCGDLSLDRPEGAGCMLALSVGDVLAACEELLADG